MRVVVLASGRGSNLQAIMDAVENNGLDIEIVRVISDNPGAKALERAGEKGIPARVLLAADFSSRQEYDRALAKAVKEAAADYVVLAGFMRLLGEEFIRQFPNRIINIHPSLLPAFPGLNAQKQAVDYGVKVSGCTVHFVDRGMDTGPIIAQKAVPVMENDTEESLAARILEQEHKLYPAVLELLSKGLVEVEGRNVKLKGE